MPPVSKETLDPSEIYIYMLRYKDGILQYRSLYLSESMSTDTFIVRVDCLCLFEGRKPFE